MTSSLSTKLRQLLKDYVNFDVDRPDIRDEINNCLQRLSTEQIGKVVSETKNSYLSSAIQLAAFRDHPEVIHSILNSVKQERRDELMKIQSKEGSAALRVAAIRGQTEVFQSIMELVSPEKVYELMRTQDGEGAATVHLLALYGHTEAMKSTLTVLTPADRLSLLQLQTNSGDTAIHWAVRKGQTETFRCIMDLLPPASQVRLLDIQNTDNRTPLEEAQCNEQQDITDFILQCREAAESYQNESHDTDHDAAGNADLLRKVANLEEQSVQQMKSLKEKDQQLESQQIQLDSQGRQISDLTNENIEQKACISDLTNENIEQKACIDEMRAELNLYKDKERQQDERIDRSIHKGKANAKDIRKIKQDLQTVSTQANRSEQRGRRNTHGISFLKLPVGQQPSDNEPEVTMDPPSQEVGTQ